MDAEVDESKPLLNTGQIYRLMRMTEVLRDPLNWESVYFIKQYIAYDDMVGAYQLWDEFTESEQEALWVAPTYGGIFTTEERKAIRDMFNNSLKVEETA